MPIKEMIRYLDHLKDVIVSIYFLTKHNKSSEEGNKQEVDENIQGKNVFNLLPLHEDEAIEHRMLEKVLMLLH